MSKKNSTGSTSESLGSSIPFSKIGQGRTQAAIALQQEIFEAYAQASNAWLTRVRSEAALWSDLVANLTATRSVPEILDAYTKCVSQQMKMTAEDGQHLMHDCQEITQKIAKSLATEWPSVRM